MLRTVCRYGAFPVLMAAGILATFTLAPRLGWPVPLVATLVALALFGVIVALERFIPYRAAWNAGDGQFGHDVGHTLFGSGVGAGLGDALNGLAVGALAGALARPGGFGLWPTTWPFWVQVVLVSLVADLGRYVQHRMHHGSAFLWRFHELHHSGQVLTAIKASRSHLVERVLQQLFMYGPLLALGAPREVLWWFIVPNSLLGPFAHCNADLRLGPLEYLVMGPGNHRLHHSANLKQSNSNFSSCLVIWDVVFGTWTSPFKHQVEGVGLEGPQPDSRFVAQLVAPFRRAKR